MNKNEGRKKWQAKNVDLKEHNCTLITLLYIYIFKSRKCFAGIAPS